MSTRRITTETGYASISTSAQGGNASHNHTGSVNISIDDHKHVGGTISINSHNHVFTGNALNMAIKYCDVIIAEKD